MIQCNIKLLTGEVSGVTGRWCQRTLSMWSWESWPITFKVTCGADLPDNHLVESPSPQMLQARTFPSSRWCFSKYKQEWVRKWSCTSKWQTWDVRCCICMFLQYVCPFLEWPTLKVISDVASGQWSFTSLCADYNMIFSKLFISTNLIMHTLADTTCKGQRHIPHHILRIYSWRKYSQICIYTPFFVCYLILSVVCNNVIYNVINTRSHFKLQRQLRWQWLRSLEQGQFWRSQGPEWAHGWVL